MVVKRFVFVENNRSSFANILSTDAKQKTAYDNHEVVNNLYQDLSGSRSETGHIQKK